MSERASDAIARELRRMVITGELQAGSIVSEAHLSDLLGCSRTPLRDALQQLSHQYLIEVPPRRGILIPRLSIVDYQQLCEAQLLVGSELTQLAAGRINDQQLDELRAVVARQERSNAERDSYSLAELDGEYHILIAEATGNLYFTDFTTLLHSALARFLYRAYESVGSADRSIAEHRQIIETLENGDGELARARVREHVIQARQRVLQILGLGDQSEGL